MIHIPGEFRQQRDGLTVGILVNLAVAGEGLAVLSASEYESPGTSRCSTSHDYLTKSSKYCLQFQYGLDSPVEGENRESLKKRIFASEIFMDLYSKTQDYGDCKEA